MHIKRFVLVTLLFALACATYGQRSLIYSVPDQDYARAMELYQKQKYSTAQHFFNKVIENPQSKNTVYRSNAEYYAALCALELFNPDAENLLVSFINTNPASNKVNEASYNMGRHYYNNKKFSDAIGWFEKTDASDLDEDKNTEFHFMAGYSYFMTQNYDKARPHFYEIKDKDSKYTAAALYYYSHIAYEQKNYETALEGFLRLRDDETFAPIVPYYITQIYFLQKKYDKVVEYAPPLLNSVIEKRVGEMAKMIGESYYRIEKYNDALPYLEKYAEKSNGMTAEDRYELGFAYYKIGDTKNAIRYFEQIAYGDNALAQNALFHLADCYIKTGEKQKARLAFSSAAKMNYSPDIKENALFNYAVVTYELSINPFNEAVKAFNEYIQLYPYSKRSDEAYNYLVLAYMSTKNYKAALESLDKIKTKDNTIRRAYQRIAFFRGLELNNNQEFDNAIVLFDKSLEFAEYDQTLAARAIYWKAESYYRLQSYKEANNLFNTFLGSPGVNSLEEYPMAYYSIAYCYFNLKDYDRAMEWFQKYISQAKEAKRNTVADSYNRIGDCQFMKPAYWVAIENYEKSIALNIVDVDYALFQKAFALGLVNRPEKKVSTLNQLLSSYPTSGYADDAYFEMGRAYISLNNSQKATETFNKLIKDYPSSSYVPKAMLQLGLICYNQDKNKEAAEYYKKIIETYPGTSYARDASMGLKTVYVDMNDVDSYFAYLDKSGLSGDVSKAEQDSLTYTAAENVYMTGDCSKSIPQFQRYIEKFPTGSFVINANFYIADCYLRSKNYDEALKGFEAVISASRSMFTGQALNAASKIYYNKKEYDKALAAFKQLEQEGELKTALIDSRVGQMRCYFALADYNNATTSAKTVLTTTGIQDEVKREARYVLAKSYIETKNVNDAIPELIAVSKDVKSAEGAECKYLLAKTYYDQGRKELAEKEIFDFIKKNTPYQFWLGKSFILLSNLYMDNKDEFQAIQTLQSLIDYYEIPNDGIIDEAKQKKEAITSKKTETQKKKESDVEINLDNQKLQ
ncbi:MAG TPA: tetratricopeptide repeat protein [Bacteroidales bacterium]|nr:tetratricopeptide repeat protein [Bacteroidales bacterium]